MYTIMFDFDGVIADSYQQTYEMIKKIGPRHGLILHDEEQFKKLLEKNFYESVSETISKEQIRSLFTDIEDNAGFFNKEVLMFGGMKDVLTKLSQKNNVYIVTSNSSQTVNNYLKQHNVKDIDVFGADHHQSKVEKIISIIKRHANYESYYIGDTKGDMIEGKKAGAKTIAVTWGYHDKKLLITAHPDYCVDKPIELLSIFTDRSS